MSLLDVVLGLDSGDRKHIHSFKIGATENAQVCQDLLVDLCKQGLPAENGLLRVIDDPKPLKKALPGCFGDNAHIQLCQVHKKRSIIDYLPEKPGSGPNSSSTGSGPKMMLKFPYLT